MIRVHRRFIYARLYSSSRNKANGWTETTTTTIPLEGIGNQSIHRKNSPLDKDAVTDDRSMLLEDHSVLSDRSPTTSTNRTLAEFTASIGDRSSANDLDDVERRWIDLYDLYTCSSLENSKRLIEEGKDDVYGKSSAEMIPGEFVRALEGLFPSYAIDEDEHQRLSVVLLRVRGKFLEGHIRTSFVSFHTLARRSLDELEAEYCAYPISGSYWPPRERRIAESLIARARALLEAWDRKRTRIPRQLCNYLVQEHRFRPEALAERWKRVLDDVPAVLADREALEHNLAQLEAFWADPLARVECAAGPLDREFAVIAGLWPKYKKDAEIVRLKKVNWWLDDSSDEHGISNLAHEYARAGIRPERAKDFVIGLCAFKVIFRNLGRHPFLAEYQRLMAEAGVVPELDTEEQDRASVWESARFHADADHDKDHADPGAGAWDGPSDEDAEWLRMYQIRVKVDQGREDEVDGEELAQYRLWIKENPGVLGRCWA